MFAICLESSHAMGMGHLFRMLNFATYLKKKNESIIFVINEDSSASKILADSNIFFITVDLEDTTKNWESEIIRHYGVKFWINDRLDTNQEHAKNIINLGIKLITFDDFGSGAKWSDLNICGLFFNKKDGGIEGKNILIGVEYLILNSEIDLYKRKRKNIKKILVTLGGSDTYGVTVKILKLLINNNFNVTIHIGPSFQHKKELLDSITDDYLLIENIPSLVQEFSKYDLAITGGGITPFEANASGLPCLIVANEDFEIPNGKFLEKIGSSKFLGFYSEIDSSISNTIQDLEINSMSANGMLNLNTNAVDKIFNKIIQL